MRFQSTSFPPRIPPFGGRLRRESEVVSISRSVPASAGPTIHRLKLDGAASPQRFAKSKRDARRLGCVLQGERRRNIVEHAVHEVGGLKQECFLEAFVESRRA